MGLSEEVAIRELLHLQSKLTAFAWSLLRDPHQADDLFQDVCLEAIRKRGEINDLAHLDSWAMRAIRFRAIDTLRADERHRRILSEQAIDQVQIAWEATEASDKSSSEALRHCVGELTDYLRQILKLRYIDGKSGAEIASILDRKVDAIYKALTRTHRALAACVRRQMAEEDSRD